MQDITECTEAGGSVSSPPAQRGAGGVNLSSASGMGIFWAGTEVGRKS